MASFWKSTQTTLEMIKWEHSIFALPFALTGAVLAAGGWPPLRVLFWIVVCMVAARSAAKSDWSPAFLDYLYVSTEHTRKAVATTNAYVAEGLTRAADTTKINRPITLVRPASAALRARDRAGDHASPVGTGTASHEPGQARLNSVLGWTQRWDWVSSSCSISRSLSAAASSPSASASSSCCSRRSSRDR